MTRTHRTLLALLVAAFTLVAAHAAPPRRTENVVFVMTDGLRWQEVFRGAEESLMTKENGAVTNVEALKKEYWRDTPEARRETLLPFFWGVLAKQGQVFGDQDRGSVARVTNGLNFSYPGYSETLCGFADPRINSNSKVPNPNVTVLEWLNQKPRYQGRVAAFGAWDVFPSIFNAQRCGFPVNAGYDPLTVGKITPRIELMNRLKNEIPRKWGGEPFDAITFYTALDYLKENRPRVFFLSLGETDEWAHEGNYAEYLHSAKRVDVYLKMLWETLQSMPQYRGKTTLIFAPDHGRGDAPEGWKHHGAQVAGSEYIWLAFLGPDTTALGDRANVPPVTQSQIAATLASLLGEDYVAAVPKAARPIADVTTSTGK